MIGSSWLSRHGRRRRLVAAALAAISVIAVLETISPGPATPTVLVASRDLTPGPLRAEDFQPATLDPPPAGAVLTIGAGQTLATPMRQGEPLTDARLLTSYRLPPGMVATPVRIADADAAALLSPGSRITLLAAYDPATPARQIAPDTTVLTIPGAAAQETDSPIDRSLGAGAGSRAGTLIVVATTPTQAADLATAQAHARLSLTIKSNSE
ncbi:RcpC/CpaB family pilus assembly protein [Nonomuraea candida]|uniref:RcpC/CpaB family pilus assembly protein n=1 Tax=Nonomuraea candida TaxID=359159 RepID=UPI0005BE4C90|nr:RcpC/CpaB family pilus assembly protein [Nonomuraea candida]